MNNVEFKLIVLIWNVISLYWDEKSRCIWVEFIIFGYEI